MYERTLGFHLRMVTIISGGIVCAAPASAGYTPYLTVEVEGTGTVTLYPTDDSYFIQDKADVNRGSSLGLHVRTWDGHPSHDDNWDIDTLIKFDLSPLPGGSNIVVATLNLFYVDYQMSYPDNRWHTCYRITGDWDEDTLTYNNRPSHAGTATTAVLLPPAPEVWVTFDVTSDVQLYVDGSDHYGWQISDDGLWNDYNIPDPWYSSKESTATGCGDGVIEEYEECDDGNTTPGDGCDENCIVEECGNGVLQFGEECDDANTEDGDGCSGICAVECGWECSGAPSVCAPFAEVYAEDFELGLGSFTIDNEFGDGNGLWHLTTVCQSPSGAHTTPTSLFYGVDPQCNYDAGLTEGVVTSPVISLTEAKPPVQLCFDYFLETEGAPDVCDMASVEVSENGGPFSTVAHNDPGLGVVTLADPSGTWESATVDLSAMAGSDIQVRFRFRTVDDAENSFDGFYVDDVKVSSAAPKRPMPEEYSSPCSSDMDCPNASVCVPPPEGEAGDGICYVPKNRYLSITRHPQQAANTARRIRCARDDQTVLGWVGEPVWQQAFGGLWLSDLVGAPVYSGGEWPDVVQVHGAGIGPAQALHVQAIHVNGDPDDEDSYSEPLELPTAPVWGDVVGEYSRGSCTPPNGVADQDDYDAVVDAFFGICPCQLWCDLGPEITNLYIDFIDLSYSLDAVIGEPYPWQTPCPAAPPPQPESPAFAKNRYISFALGNPGRDTALRVTLTDLPAPFEDDEGCQLWVGEPFQVTELAGSGEPTPPPSFWSANLQTTWYCMDWGTLGVVHVTDNEIVPRAICDVQAIDCTADPLNGANYSDPLPIGTSMWGDIVGDCGVTPCTAPNDVVDFIDIAALVDKFKNLDSGPIKARADLAGDMPDRIIDFVDISNDVDAFKGFAYPFNGPDLAPCP